MLTLAQIQTEAYATACEKGWHDRPLRELPGDWVGDAPLSMFVHHDRVLAKHALMHTELTEAAECLEAGDITLRHADGKPEGFAAEAADIVVRVCDTTKALGVDFGISDVWLTLAADGPAALDIRGAALRRDEVRVALCWLERVRQRIDRATEAARVDDWQAYREALSMALVYVASICAGLNIDLPAAIEAKMAYNKTRPHRHGGKQA